MIFDVNIDVMDVRGRPQTTTQLTVNNIFISILFDFRILIIQPTTVAMAPSCHGSR
jgi:hypothetical protein